MLATGETCNLIDKLFSPSRFWHPDLTGRNDVRYSVQATNLVITFTRCELLRGDTHRPELVYKWRTCRLFLNQYAVRLPFLVMPERRFLQLDPLHPSLERVEQDDVG